MGKRQNKTVVLRASDVKRLKAQATDEAVQMVMALFFTVLRDKNGFGKTRLTRVYNQINDLSDSVSQGYVSIRDLQQTMLEEIGIDLGGKK